LTRGAGLAGRGSGGLSGARHLAGAFLQRGLGARDVALHLAISLRLAEGIGGPLERFGGRLLVLLAARSRRRVEGVGGLGQGTRGRRL
jgi:hypothetical protein